MLFKPNWLSIVRFGELLHLISVCGLVQCQIDISKGIPYKTYGLPEKCLGAGSHAYLEQKYNRCQSEHIDRWRLTLNSIVSDFFLN